MWAPYITEYRRNEKAGREGSHARKDSAMDDHLAYAAMSAVSAPEGKIGCYEAEIAPPLR